MWPERVPGTESANPTIVWPSKAPITWPPTLSATTNIRRGTSSASLKFHTSFCSATQARKSSMPRHRRSSTDMSGYPLRRGEGSLSAGGSRRLLLGLRTSPQRLQFLHGSLIRRAPRLLQPSFHPLKAPLELAVAFAQSRFGIDRNITRDVHQNEEEVADLFFQTRLQTFRNQGAAGPGYPAPRWTRPGSRNFPQLLAQFLGLFL